MPVGPGVALRPDGSIDLAAGGIDLTGGRLSGGGASGGEDFDAYLRGREPLTAAPRSAFPPPDTGGPSPAIDNILRAANAASYRSWATWNTGHIGGALQEAQVQ